MLGLWTSNSNMIYTIQLSYGGMLYYGNNIAGPIKTSNWSVLDTFSIYADGSNPDFRNIDHSFTLRISELVNTPRNTGINSKKTTFLNTMKEIAS